MRNQASFVSSMELPDHVAISKRKHHDRSFNARFANIGNIDMEYSWGGKLCLSLNDVPAFGAIEDGITAACCQNGLGTAKGTLAGIGAVELAVRANSPIVQDLQSYDLPQKLPHPLVASLGAKLVLGWREFKAGAEI